MIKLIASDLDGTLLDNNGNIPKEFGWSSARRADNDSGQIYHQ